jgi:hypothetical protein
MELIVKRLLQPVALVVVGMLVGGGIAADAVTTTDPVTLKIRAVLHRWSGRVMPVTLRGRTSP